MSIDTKSLEKLAKMCRKAGIKHFKSSEFEFTLTEETPNLKPNKKIQGEIKASIQGDVRSDEQLSDEALMFYSSFDPLSGNQETQ